MSNETKRDRRRSRSKTGLSQATSTGYLMPLKMAILESGLSQMAVAAKTGMHSSQVSLIVRGWREPSAVQRAKLSAALGRSERELFPGVAA